MRVGTNRNDQVQVAGRSAVAAGLAATFDPDALAVFDTGWDLDGQRLTLARSVVASDVDLDRRAAQGDLEG